MRVISVCCIFVCLEICLTAKKHFLASPSQENMRDWVNALHNAAVSLLFNIPEE